MKRGSGRIPIGQQLGEVGAAAGIGALHTEASLRPAAGGRGSNYSMTARLVNKAAATRVVDLACISFGRVGYRRNLGPACLAVRLPSLDVPPCAVAEKSIATPVGCWV